MKARTFSVLCVLLAAHCLAAPTTQPAAPVYSDLQARIDNTPAYGPLVLPAGIFKTVTNIAIKRPIWILGACNADGSPATTIQRAAGPNSPVALWVQAGPTVLLNLAIESDQPVRPVTDHTATGVTGLIVSAPNVSFINGTINTVDTGVELYPGQFDTDLINVHGLPGLVGDFVYGGGGAETTKHGRIILHNCSACDSHTQHNLRFSSIVTPSTFVDAVIVGGEYSNSINGNESLAFRDGSGCYAIGASFTSPLPVQLGQGVPTPLGVADCQSLHFFGCQFSGGQANLRYCEQLDFLNCTSMLPAGKHTAISVGNAAGVSIRNLTINAATAGQVTAAVTSPTAVAAPATVTATGVTIVLPPAATQPAATIKK